MSAAGFMEKLLDGAEVEWLPLRDLCRVKAGQNINKKLIAAQSGDYPVINSGKNPLGYVNHFNTEDDPIGIASRGSVGLVTWTPGRFFRGNLNYACTVYQSERLSVRFLYHFLLCADSQIQALSTHEGIPALNASALKQLPIPIPCPKNPEKSLAIQAEIVRVLDAFTELTTELTTELAAREKQYNYYRDQLLQFSGPNAQGTDKMEWKPLGDVGEFIRGKRFTKSDYVESGIPAIHYGDIYTHYGVSACSAISQVRTELKDSLRYARHGDVVLASVSETVEDVGKSVAWLGDEEVAVHDDTFVFRLFRHEMNPKFVSYVFQTAKFNSEKIKFVSKGKIKRLQIKGVAKIEIPCPPLDVQSRIVAILDKFDTLTHSISEGLPREIELRQKQYEYYRDLLLDFPKPGSKKQGVA